MKNYLLKVTSSFAFIFILLLSSLSFAVDVKDFDRIAIQDGGRIKPFNTFARESVQLITGSTNHNNKNATEIVLSWLFLPDQWAKQAFIQVKHLELKKDLGIPDTESFISPQDIMQNAKLPSLFTQMVQLQKEKKKLTPYFTALQRLNNQMSLFQEIISGTAFKVVPQPISGDWLPITEIKDDLKTSFTAIASGFFQAITQNDDQKFKTAVADFKKLAMAQAPNQYPSSRILEMEIAYNTVHPFRISYILYLVSVFLFAISLKFIHSKAWRIASLSTAFAGIAVHTWGFTYRCIIAGRPPVSNMYESVIWVALGCMAFGLLFELIYKKRYIGIAAAAMTTIALIIGDSVPAVLDQSIRPLEPVLRSNYWLTIHVLTITLSYGAFALATSIGNMALWSYVKGTHLQNREKLNNLSLFIYKCLQIGVLLLTAGTILGGVWADYSWGRFWGWDPKETWALIADLGYLAILHGRFSGWLRTFGTIAASVIAFSGVVMAWYGVNFVLGVGLHSYGFGAGGVHYVTAILLVQLAYVGLAAYRFKKTK